MCWNGQDGSRVPMEFNRWLCSLEGGRQFEGVDQVWDNPAVTRWELNTGDDGELVRYGRRVTV